MAKIRKKTDTGFRLIHGNKFLYDQIDLLFKQLNKTRYKIEDGLKLFELVLKYYDKIILDYKGIIPDEAKKSLKTKKLYICYISSNRYEFQIENSKTSIIIER